MKYTLLIFLSVIVLTSCSEDKTEIVKETLSNINTQKLKKVESILTEDFTYINGDTIDKSEFLKMMNGDSFMIIGVHPKYYISELNETKSTVTSIETQTTIMDSLLGVKNLVQVQKTYSFKEGRINQIKIDSVIKNGDYLKEAEELSIPFATYHNDKYRDEINKRNKEELKQYYAENVLNWLIEYSKLPKEEKEKYKLLSTLTGTFISETSIYRKLTFKGKSTVVIYDKFIGIPFPTSYVIDEDYIRITTDKSDLLLRIKDNKTLEGEGWAKGTFKKTQ